MFAPDGDSSDDILSENAQNLPPAAPRAGPPRQPEGGAMARGFSATQYIVLRYQVIQQRTTSTPGKKKVLGTSKKNRRKRFLRTQKDQKLPFFIRSYSQLTFFNIRKFYATTAAVLAMYHAACKVEFQPFNRSYSQMTSFDLPHILCNYPCIRETWMYNAACKVECQPFKRSYSQMTFKTLNHSTHVVGTKYLEIVRDVFCRVVLLLL